MGIRTQSLSPVPKFPADEEKLWDFPNSEKVSCDLRCDIFLLSGSQLTPAVCPGPQTERLKFWRWDHRNLLVTPELHFHKDIEVANHKTFLTSRGNIRSSSRPRLTSVTLFNPSVVPTPYWTSQIDRQMLVTLVWPWICCLLCSTLHPKLIMVINLRMHVSAWPDHL